MYEHILQKENPLLRQTAKVIPKKEIASPQLKRLIVQMKKLLAQEDNGVGLAAPQVGAPLRLFIVSGRAFETAKEEGASKTTPSDMVYINPEAVRFSRSKKEMAEGCLSVRGKYGTVIRHEKMTLRGLDEEGKPFLRHASGLLAHIFQHELDHLDGILYTDKALRLEDEEESKTLRKKYPPGEKQSRTVPS